MQSGGLNLPQPGEGSREDLRVQAEDTRIRGQKITNFLVLPNIKIYLLYAKLSNNSQPRFYF